MKEIVRDCQILLILSAILFSSISYSQSNVRLIFPTATEETDYIWRTIIDTRFFKENNYQVSLPEGKLIKTLQEKALKNQLSDKDYKKLKQFVTAKVFNKKDYLKGYEKTKKDIKLIETLLKQIDEDELNWDFKKFKTYEVILTLYGPGGSFDPETGRIILYITKEGNYKQYKKAAHTIIHEITHIGIQESIVNEFNVAHTLKERIVDLFVKLYFGKQLPNYKIQDMGDYRIDPYLKSKNDIKTLNKYVRLIE